MKNEMDLAVETPRPSVFTRGRRTYVTVLEAARRLGIGRVTAYRLIDEGRLKSSRLKVEGQWRLVVPEAEIARRQTSVAAWRAVVGSMNHPRQAKAPLPLAGTMTRDGVICAAVVCVLCGEVTRVETASRRDAARELGRARNAHLVGIATRGGDVAPHIIEIKGIVRDEPK